MTLKDIIDTLKAEVIVDCNNISRTIKCACATDLMSEVLYYSISNAILITGLVRSHAVRTADVAEIDAVIFTKSKKPDSETIEFARNKGISIVVTPLSTFAACGMLYEKGLRCCPEEEMKEKSGKG